MAGSYNIEWQVSPRGGVAESDFVPVTLDTNAGAGYATTEAESALYSPAAAGNLYLFRARYVCASDSSVFSDWAYVPARGMYPPTKGTTMGFGVVVGAQTQNGIGVESAAGQNVQAAYGLDATNVNFPEPRGIVVSEVDRNTPSAVSDETAGDTPLTGSFNFDLRPVGASPRVLTSFYLLDPAQTVTVAAVTAAITGTTANASPTVTSVSSFVGLVVGQPITGTNIPAGTVIQALNPTAATITLSQNATGTNSGLTVYDDPDAVHFTNWFRSSSPIRSP